MLTFPVYMIYLWTLVTIGRPQDIFPILKVFHPGDIVAALSIIGYFASGTRRQSILSFKEVKLFMLLFLLAVICTPFGFYPRGSMLFIYAFFLKTAIYLYLVVSLMTTEERITGLIKTIVFSGIMMAIFVVLRFQLSLRVGGGSTYDPNDVAMLFVAVLPISYMLLRTPLSTFWRVFYYLGCFFCLAGLIATQSRGGFLGLSATAVYIILHKTTVFPKKRLIGFIVILAAIFLLVAGVEYKERLGTILDDVTSVEAGSGRIAVWKRGLVVFQDHPILGVGPGSYTTAIGQYLDENRFEGNISKAAAGPAWKTAHNSFLLISVELGILGLLLFCKINLLTFKNLRKIQSLALKSKAKDHIATAAVGMEFGLFGLLICAFFLSQSYNTIIYLFCFLSGSMIHLVRRRQEAKDKPLSATVP